MKKFYKNLFTGNPDTDHMFNFMIKNVGFTEFIERNPYTEYYYPNHIVKDKKFVTDIIGDDWKNLWNSYTPVFINTNTGSGKNFFVKEKILPWVLNNNESKLVNHKVKIVYFSNRTALDLQMKQDIVAKIDSICANNNYEHNRWTDYDVKGQIKLHDFANGDIKLYKYHDFIKNTYEEIINDLQQAVPIHTEDETTLVFFDEAHFFASDAGFNSSTEIFLKALINHFKKAIRVYMSATIDAAFDTISIFEEAIAVDVARDNTSFFMCSNIYSSIPNTQLYLYNKLFLPLVIKTQFQTPQDGFMDNLKKQYIRLFAWQNGQITWINQNGQINLFSRADGLEYYFLDSYQIEATENVSSMYTNSKKYFLPFKANKQYIYDNAREYKLYIKPQLLKISQDDYLGNDKDLDMSQYLARVITEKGGKWLIFISRYADGSAIKKAINSINDKLEVNVLSAQNKDDSADYKEIIQSNKFSSDILISTATLDNGINIEDDELQNILILPLNRIEYIQMLGRVRNRTEDNPINLYIVDYDKDFVSDELKKDMKDLRDRFYDILVKKENNRLVSLYSDLDGQNAIYIKQLISRTFELKQILQSMTAGAVDIPNVLEGKKWDYIANILKQRFINHLYPTCPLDENNFLYWFRNNMLNKWHMITGEQLELLRKYLIAYCTFNKLSNYKSCRSIKSMIINSNGFIDSNQIDNNEAFSKNARLISSFIDVLGAILPIPVGMDTGFIISHDLMCREPNYVSQEIRRLKYVSNLIKGHNDYEYRRGLEYYDHQLLEKYRVFQEKLFQEKLSGNETNIKRLEQLVKRYQSLYNQRRVGIKNDGKIGVVAKTILSWLGSPDSIDNEDNTFLFGDFSYIQTELDKDNQENNEKNFNDLKRFLSNFVLEDNEYLIKKDENSEKDKFELTDKNTEHRLSKETQEKFKELLKNIGITDDQYSNINLRLKELEDKLGAVYQIYSSNQYNKKDKIATKTTKVTEWFIVIVKKEKYIGS